MSIWHARCIAASVALFIAVSFASRTFAQGTSAANILIGDAKSQPESLTMAPGGVLIVGSASSPFVYKVRSGSSTAEKFIDVSSEPSGTFFLGMLADAATNTLWTCQLTPVPNTTPPQRHTALRSFDLTSGAAKIRWNLPGDNNVCNDFTIGPDKALYITDTIPGRIFRLPAGASDRGALPGSSDASRGRWHHLPGWHALCKQRNLQQALSHSRRCDGQTGSTCRHLDGSTSTRTRWHACRERKAYRRRECQWQNFRSHRQWRQGKRDCTQGRTQHTHRSRTCGRHDLDRRAGGGQSLVDSHA